MKFPDKPTCHQPMGPMFKIGNTFEWNGPRPVTSGPGTHLSHHTRTCSYCGSVHPEDLLRILENGGDLGGSDWKYGWPHKFYVTALNPSKGEITQIGSSSGPVYSEEGALKRDAEGNYLRKNEPIMGASGDFHGKWYNEHIMDDGFDDEARAALISALEKHSHIRFSVDPEKGLGYAAPHRGYQKG
jgi:hypothetical protein